MFRTVALIVALVMCMTVAIANEQFKTTLISAPGSPVRLNDCEASARDFSPSAGWPQILDFYLDLGAKFTNASHKSLKDVEFGFVAYDSEGSMVSSVDLSVSKSADAGVKMKPGAVVDLLGQRGWQGNNRSNGKDHVQCSVERVTFSDGSIWQSAASSPTPTPRYSTAPIEIDEVDFTNNAKLNLVTVGVTFTNVSSKTATAIRFEIIPKDAFGSPLFPIAQNGDCIGTYSPGVRIVEGPKGCDGFKIFAPGKVASVHATVVKVIFSDGTLWQGSP